MLSLVKDFPLFKILEIETCSYCPARCKTCLRNTYPYRPAINHWLEESFLSDALIRQVMHEAKNLGFKGACCLQHFNEPTCDDRIAEFGSQAMAFGFNPVFACTNSVYLTDWKIAQLDGNFHSLSVAIYHDNKKARMAELISKFKHTRLEFMVWPHITTHFSPNSDLLEKIGQQRYQACGNPTLRMLINHRGDQLLCCEDMIGHWDLGSIYHQSIEELWFGEKHVRLVNELLEPGGRMKHSYCRICPR